jgi:catechol 2,3-dioxygenase-like lactoylglutathione lyase family enzyme
VLIDCELMGSERRFELHVPDVEQAWPFYRDIMCAREVFRSEPGVGGPTRIGFTIGRAGFTLTSQDRAGSHDGGPVLSRFAADFGAAFAAIVVYVQDPLTAARRALDAGSRLQPEATSGTPTYRGNPVEVIIDPFGNSWAFAKS